MDSSRRLARRGSSVRARERNAAQDYYLRLVYAVRDRLIRGSMNEESVSRLCSGEAVLATPNPGEITQFMLALGESLLRLLKCEGDAHKHRLIAERRATSTTIWPQRLTLQKVSGPHRAQRQLLQPPVSGDARSVLLPIPDAKAHGNREGEC